MEWTENIQRAINYMEHHLLDTFSATDVAEEIHMSSFYLQKGFKIMTGYTIGEYIRNRRLYLAALDVIADREKVVELAYKYGYDTPESFSKAFHRFHGVSPMQMKKDMGRLNIFLPLKIKILVQGGNDMDYTVEKMHGLKMIGFEKDISYDTAYKDIPKYWGWFFENYLAPLFSGKNPEGEGEQAVCSCNIGEFGVCIDGDGQDKTFRYMIAGTYHGGNVPDGMTVFELPDLEWAKFTCTGPLPGALQAVNTKIFSEWLPGNPDYEIADGISLEWYSRGDNESIDYESEIWIPVKRKV